MTFRFTFSRSSLGLKFSSGILLLCGLFFSGCGNEIGDSCSISTDCSTTGERLCDSNSPGGYCTMIGCDVGTCPDEAVCVRFYPVTSSNRPCVPTTEDRSTNDCTDDEICTFSNRCSPRNSEVRYCMKTCDGSSDCRDDYECREESLMKTNGGESVPEIGEATGSNIDPFCAAKPVDNS